ncbi:paraquat-inducible protein [Pseudoalteromonas ruthenica]|uniref:Paraquat-inducible protein n=1 Tax=Pseudoalteromonas ruthenica TaxID=151081 RepID=A0A5S3Z1P7_9GAMM|nr:MULTISPECIES: PqiA/YebS family transporter subunit [Pseudoalteromonas]MCF2860572.1 PqiA/YebS family transporter subunit [Pseudoalteromonas sp. CNAT2-18]MCG7556441.1 PqiA/YebS family transporter subunit [Pseudoalteromonas sp. CNAT2-18.1]MCG7569338.1 PqiA/YebS family transporter subunit [Pseudoalteromonas sp. CNC9-20]TMP85685.1 paraquat-inducible protein [Pseudoalteromonas ruthenica]
MQLACPQCDLVVDVPRLQAKQVAQCPHCHSSLNASNVNNDPKVVALTLSAIILLLSSVFYPFISFSSRGITQTMTLPDAGRMLFNYDSTLLGIFIDISIIILPLVMLLLLLPLHLGFLRTLPKHWGRKLLKLTLALDTWVMSEIFLVGVLVSMVKIMSMADITFGISFWAYGGFVLTYIGALSYVNRPRLWRQIAPHKEVAVPKGVRAIDVNLRACHVCQQLTYDKLCPRCHSTTHYRNMQSVQKAAAWLVTSVLLYIPANVLPIMYTTSLGDREPSTLIGGVILLWQSGSYPIASIIFLASVVVPFAKALVLATLCVMVYRQASRRSMVYTRLYQVTEFIGKWSMIDVFVVAILVALVQLGNLMLVEPGLGALCFAAMVICQMMAAHAFDPRLIWDPPEKVKRVVNE